VTVPTLILAGDSDLVTKCEASQTWRAPRPAVAWR
jgi:alpha-beta hydrolase superfamily lysophospholipase